MKIRYALPALAAAALLTLTGCVTNEEGPKHESTDTSKISVDEKAAALVPADIKDTGKLVLGTDGSYPPNEYKNSSGEIVGWGVDLANAVSARLGLEPVWEEASFDTIIPSIQGGKMNMGSSSFTDNAERQKTVDFVNFYEAGVLWAAPIGSDIDPNNACGLKVAVQSGTFEHTDELPAKSAECEAAGKPKIDIMPFEGQAEATNAVVLGQAEAFSADSPVTLDAIAAQSDKIAAAGETFDVAPYGYALPKDTDLTKAVQLALQSLMDDGTYLEILTKAGVEDGAIEKATINAGS
ncbi:ABC transporter substrate-binding protein [Leucobacter chromiireducens]|uniref:ABC transporter substrate-binding protein n=1 Tax=Leucobacter chromiireducens subsp. chromiireducens TaxID=660067 RepID=A0ABS1SNC3_9MICO|nr:ABC transporter substrate-binding protein [Leucobacter chromiireducens]MBL3688401.1 ABC transporter substrate-binding protein [Leucobacter chromiireducens subsp. chromiireducens]